MNIFKSVFPEDPTPPDSPASSPDPDPAISESTWSFGGLLKTLATKSESVIETYRKDIEDLGSGLRNETSVIREAASRAVKHLPSSLDAGASVAQDSLETVGQAIDDLGSTVWRSTARIILGKGIFDSGDSESATSSKRGGFDVRYSRFDAQVRGMQGDLYTYCSEPEDKQDYEEWRLKCWVVDEGTKEEIVRLFGENEVVRDVYNEVVPSKVDNETFWRRYFYRLNRLKKAEEARVLIVKKAISLGEGEEEDLGWDFEEDEAEGCRRNDVAKVEYEAAGHSGNGVAKVGEEEAAGIDVAKVGEEEAAGIDVAKVEEEAAGNSGNDVAKVEEEEKAGHSGNDEAKVEEEEVGGIDGSNDKLEDEEKDVVAEGRGNGTDESSKDSDISVVSAVAEEEEDLGWDEIEYSGSNDEEGKGEEGVGRTISSGVGSGRVDVRKRLSAAEEEEGLNWDVEDE